MIVATVVLCPPEGEQEPYDRVGVARALTVAVPTVAVLVVPPVTDAPWVAGVALAIGADVRGPVLPVLAAGAGVNAPALGLAQRAARRAVAGYVLLDTEPPSAAADGPEWPDAPVVYLASPAAPAGAVDHARLRAWRRIDLSDRAGSTVAATLARLCREG